MTRTTSQWLLIATLMGPSLARAGERPTSGRADGAAAATLPFQTEEPGLPQVDATLAPDGHFTLVLRADVAWSQAEVTVGGSPAVVVGPSLAGHPVRIDGVTEGRGLLDISITAVDPAARGIQWLFSVEPAEVPSAAPPLAPSPRGRHRQTLRERLRGRA